MTDDPDRNDDPVDLKEPGRTDPEETMWMRLLWLVLIAIMISLAQTILLVVAALQFIIMLTSKREANPRLAEFGSDVGLWVAKAARYQSAQSDTKPWPWTPLD